MNFLTSNKLLPRINHLLLNKIESQQLPPGRVV